MLIEEQLTEQIIGSAIEVHREHCGYRLDLLVEDRVVVELKSIEEIVSVHHAQLLTYLRLSGKKVGLLINFNVPVLKNGIVRRVL